VSSLTIAEFHTTWDQLSVPCLITVEWSKHAFMHGHAGYVVTETVTRPDTAAGTTTRQYMVYGMHEKRKAVAYALRRFWRYEKLTAQKDQRNFVR
jgi:hypothetical protein